VFAPGYSPEALEVLAAKKNLRLLDSRGARPGSGRALQDFRRISGGLLLQDADIEPAGNTWRTVIRRAPGDDEMAALNEASAYSAS